MGFFDKAMKFMMEIGEEIVKEQLVNAKKSGNLSTREIREKETLNKEFSQAKKDTDRLIYKKEKLEKKIEKISNNEELSSEEKENQIAELKLQINVLNEEIKISRKDTISKFKTVSNNTNDDF
ncbi:hypothetical protein [Leptotrichia wadei]|jgi:hypothetical protein|uniref:hypothetical protein n=1 Tax=Leptotrichia wadei TaxID=157687 RepID=UPI0028E5A455|nr:hypothetical protein [Leptotrichia wadei]